MKPGGFDPEPLSAWIPLALIAAVVWLAVTHG